MRLEQRARLFSTEERGMNMLYDPKYKFDELGDVAFAEIRVIMDRMERNKEIEVENLSCEEMAYECKKLAHEFMAKYDAACELGEFPDFYSTLDVFIYDRLLAQFPPHLRNRCR